MNEYYHHPNMIGEVDKSSIVKEGEPKELLSCPLKMDLHAINDKSVHKIFLSMHVNNLKKLVPENACK